MACDARPDDEVEVVGDVGSLQSLDLHELGKLRNELVHALVHLSASVLSPYVAIRIKFRVLLASNEKFISRNF